MKTDEYRCEVDYDSEFDQLSFKRKGFHSSGAIRAGPFTLDFYKHELVGIEVEGASSLLHSFFNLDLELSKLEKARIGFREEGKTLLIFFTILHNGEEIRKEVLVPKVEAVPLLA